MAFGVRIRIIKVPHCLRKNLILTKEAREFEKLLMEKLEFSELKLPLHLNGDIRLLLKLALSITSQSHPVPPFPKFSKF